MSQTPSPHPVSQVSELKPCPFCGEQLERSEQFSSRSADTWMHPDNGCILAMNMRVIVPLAGYRTDREGEDERVAAWNRRSTSALPTEEAEPAAWRRERFEDRPSDVTQWAETAVVWKDAGFTVRPLYTHPSSTVSAEVTDYLVWSNEHHAWWRHKSQGYARNILEAGRYTRAEAVDIADKSRDGWEVDRRPDEIAVAIADLPQPIRAALATLGGGRG